MTEPPAGSAAPALSAPGPDRAGVRTVALLSLAFSAAGLAVGFFALAFAVEPLRFGQWPQSEPVVAALFLAGALCWCGLLAAAANRPARGAAVLTSPVVLAPLLLALWTGLVSPFQAVPMMTWFGFPNLGEGVLWWLSVAGMTAGALIVKPVRRLTRPLLLLGLGLMAVYAALTLLFGKGSAYAPYWFPDYLAFAALFLVPAAACWTRWRSHLAVGAAVCAAGVLLVLSNNMTAWGATIGVGLPSAALAWFLQGRRWPGPNRLRAMAIAGVAMVPLVVTAAVLATGDYLEVETNWDRARLLDLVGIGFADRPERLVTGFGWGQVSDLLARYLLLEEVSLAHDGAWSPNWAAATWVHWHTHNQFADALVAGGMVALGLFVLVTVAPVVASPARRLPLSVLCCAAFAATASTWFQMPGTLAVMAVGTAGLARARVSPVRHLAHPGLARPLAAICAAVLTLGVVAQAELAIRAEAVRRIPLSDLARRADTCPDLLRDHGRGGIHLGDQYLERTNRLVRAARESSETDASTVTLDTLKGLRAVACAADRWRSEDGSSLRLALSSVLALGELAFLPPPAAELVVQAGLLTDWEDRLSAFLDRAPGRIDVSAPYYGWLLGLDREAAALAFAESRLAQAPSDSVAMWYSGIVLLGDPDRAEYGMRRLRRALDLGVEGIILVRPEDAAQIRGVGGAGAQP